MRRFLTRSLQVSALLVLWTCAATGSRAVETEPHGVWSADGIRVTLAGTRGTVEFDCGSASIDTLLARKSMRRFRGTGLLFPAAGGPAIYPPPPGREPKPIKIRGRLRDDRLRLAIIRPKPRLEGERRRTVYRLAKGNQGVLRKCL